MLRSGPMNRGSFADVVDEDRPPLLDRRADDALADLEAKRLGDVLRITDGVRDVQLLPRLVEQIHRERAEPREPRDELRDLFEEIREVEHRRDLAPELEQRRQQFGVGRADEAVRLWAARGLVAHRGLWTRIILNGPRWNR